MLLLQKSFVGVQGTQRISVVDLGKGGIAKLPLSVFVSVHVFFDCRGVQKGVNADMVNARIISRLVQTLLKQVMNISATYSKIRCYFLLHAIAIWSPKRAMSFVVVKGFAGDEEIIA